MVLITGIGKTGIRKYPFENNSVITQHLADHSTIINALLIKSHKFSPIITMFILILYFSLTLFISSYSVVSIELEAPFKTLQSFGNYVTSYLLNK